ncbi:MAG: GntR family transcriptional regulator [Treponemataceae bacterium]
MSSYERNRPIYLQIMERIKESIISGELALGDRILSIRDMALEMGVNPNTMSRVYMELEREGVIETLRGTGSFVVKDKDLIPRLKKEIFENWVLGSVSSLVEAGFTDEEIIDYVKKALKRVRSEK